MNVIGSGCYKVFIGNPSAPLSFTPIQKARHSLAAFGRASVRNVAVAPHTNKRNGYNEKTEELLVSELVLVFIFLALLLIYAGLWALRFISTEPS